MSRRPPARDFALGLALTVVLNRLGAGGDGASAGTRPVSASRSAAARPSPRRRPLTLFMLASLAVGLVLMLVFHSPVTLTIGVLALFAFIVSGVFLIADPAFLGPDEDLPALGDREPG
jgi:hypothetical protein